MPWNQDSGGSRGGGGSGDPKNPWGGGPWGQKPGDAGKPPNIEELLKQGQERIKSILPGGFPKGKFGKGYGLFLLGVLAVLVWLASGFYRVLPDQVGVVLRFGAFSRIALPGLHYHFPAPIETSLTPSVTRDNRIEIGFRSSPPAGRLFPAQATAQAFARESIMLTGDENIIDVDFVLFWRVKDPNAFLFQIGDPERLIRDTARSAMREIIGQTPIQQALTEGRGKIEADTKSLVQNLLDSYGVGVEVRQIQLLEVDPPKVVVDAFNEVQRAKTDRERSRNEAETYRNNIIPRARGEAERVLQEAQAYREQVVQRAEGDTKRFLATYDAYKVSKDITMRRIYLETMEQIFRKSRKIIMDQRVSNSGILPYLPLSDTKPPLSGVGSLPPSGSETRPSSTTILPKGGTP